MDLISKFPEIKIPNKIFHNGGNLQFSEIGNAIDNNQSTFSNGAVYADFDNDGDLDVLVNNIDAPALLYENKTNLSPNNAYADIRLKGPEKNLNAIGSKIILFANGGIRTYEKFPVKGFLSSMETPVHIGLERTTIDSAFLVWPDNSFERIKLAAGVKELMFTYKKGLPIFNYSILTGHYKNPTRPMEDITNQVQLQHKHEENYFHEFDREPLIPHMVSTEGPALAVADINHDGLEDVFIGAAKWKKSSVFLQDASGKFKEIREPSLGNDSVYEDVDACWVDVNHDGTPDLVVASGGNEFYGNDNHLTPRVYLNDGKGNLSKLDAAFTNLYVNASCVVPFDFNGDGYTDLFIGGRSVPFNYGEIPKSYLLQNDGTGRFTDVTAKYSQELSRVGFVTRAIWFDLDKDGEKDLLLTLEWGGIVAFMNNGNTFTEKIVTDKRGWWNNVLPVDIDGDGDIDLVAGNLGLNSRLKASDSEPVRMYFNDFDGNGKKEQLLTYYLGGKQIPFANKDELQRQLPMLKKKFIKAEDFAKASLAELFPGGKLNESDTLTANYFANSVLINDGHMNFSIKPLPWEAQLSSYRDAVVVNANNDSLPDILLVGNFYDNNIQMGRYDADFGTILVNKGNGNFETESINGLLIKGQVRRILPIGIARRQAYILVRNNDSTRVVQFRN